MAVCPREDGHLILPLLPSWALGGSHNWRSPEQPTGQSRNLSMARSLWKRLSLIKSIPSLLFLRIPMGTKSHLLCLVDKNKNTPRSTKFHFLPFVPADEHAPPQGRGDKSPPAPKWGERVTVSGPFYFLEFTDVSVCAQVSNPTQHACAWARPGENTGTGKMRWVTVLPKGNRADAFPSSDSLRCRSNAVSREPEQHGNGGWGIKGYRFQEHRLPWRLGGWDPTVMSDKLISFNEASSLREGNCLPFSSRRKKVL